MPRYSQSNIIFILNRKNSKALQTNTLKWESCYICIGTKISARTLVENIESRDKIYTGDPRYNGKKRCIAITNESDITSIGSFLFKTVTTTLFRSFIMLLVFSTRIWRIMVENHTKNRSF